MSSIAKISLPNAILIEEEVKICKGCLQDQAHFLVTFQKDREGRFDEIGLTDAWESSYSWGGKKITTYTVKHINNHPDCYNYDIKLIQKILYGYFEIDQSE